MNRILEQIDVDASARFLRLPPGTALRPRDLLLPGAVLGRALLNRVVHPSGRFFGWWRSLYRNAVRRVLPAGHAPILVRVDDYPRADVPMVLFFEFARILGEHGIQMLLGVTPLMRRGRTAGLVDGEVRWLADAAADGRVRIAMHGTTHENLTPGMGRHDTTEIVGVHPERLRLSLQAGLAALARAGLPRPAHYIPPFNSVDARAWVRLAEEYRFIHGGPLSIDTLGPLAPGVLIGGAHYLPSHRPLYGRAFEQLSALGRIRPPSDERRFPLVLTLHWAWEQHDGMGALRQLARALAGRTGRWEDLEAQAAGSAPAACLTATAALGA
jgi:hypothetical protein